MDSFLGAYERENKIVWGRVGELEAEEKRLKARIEKLEAALKKIALDDPDCCMIADRMRETAEKALEGKDD